MHGKLESQETTKDMRLHWGDGVALFLLCMAAVAFYRQIALTDLVLSGGDAFTYFYPYRDYAARVLREGQIPLWNPYLFLGVPFVANSQTAVFYPLNLALMWLSGPKLVTWSIVLHAALAACATYLYARRVLRLPRAPAFLAGEAFAFGGFLSGQAEHVNQVNALAWCPLFLLLWEMGHRPGRGRLAASLGLGVVIGMSLLAGHSQASYISLVGLTVYACLPLLAAAWHALKGHTSWAAILRHALVTVLRLGFAGLIGAALAAVQILPTLELAQYSIRSSGLSYREAVSFSLKPLPRLLRYTLLPPWGANLSNVFGGPFFTEYLAYVGALPLLLAVLGAAWCFVRAWRTGSSSLHEGAVIETSPTSGGQGWIARKLLWLHEGTSLRYVSPQAGICALAILGLALALGLYNPLYWVLYKVLPGFNLFRVPARWLALYAFSTAMLAGMGAAQALAWLRAGFGGLTARWATPAVGALLAVTALAELFAASQPLPLNHPTAPEAYSALRTAPTHILVAQGEQVAPGRLLSMSDILFDPGDLPEIRQIYADQLSEQALYDYVVCVKRKEILAPNLPLAWQIYAVDGYDGGVLPLARYIHLQRLLLDEDQILSDGRLREGLQRVPPSRLLSILGVRYVLTDKVHDVWIDDVFYDLAFEALLNEDGSLAGTTGITPEGNAVPARSAAPAASTEDIPPFIATALGVVSYLEGAQSVAADTPVAEVRLTTERGTTERFTLYAGRDTAEGDYPPDTAHPQARVGRTWADQPEGSDYVTRLRWEKPSRIVRLEIVALPFAGRIHIRGLTLIDERDGSNVPVLLSTDGRFRQVHSGDVKIYEVLDALPRAYVVHQARILADDEASLATLADPAFDPAQTVVLAGGQALEGHPIGQSQVTVESYTPREVAIQASLHTPGYLVLSDTWYPGWQATVNGQPAAIERANVHFRAVYLPAGEHRVHLFYRPMSYYGGLGISALAACGLALYGVLIAQSALVRSK